MWPRLTQDQWEMAVAWMDFAERTAHKHVPKDRDASHDLAVDSVMRAVSYSEQTSLGCLLVRIIRGNAFKRTAKRKRFHGIRERDESLDWVNQDDQKVLQYTDVSLDRVDVDDVIDYIAGDLYHTIPIVLKAVASGEEQKHACISRGFKYRGVRGSIQAKQGVLRARLASQLEIT